MAPPDRGQQLQAAPPPGARGPRSARRPRAHVAHLLAGLLGAQNEDPNIDTPPYDGSERKRHPAAAGGAGQAAGGARGPAAGQQAVAAAALGEPGAAAAAAAPPRAAPPPAKRRRGAAAAVAAVVLAEASSDSEDEAEGSAAAAAVHSPEQRAGAQQQSRKQQQQQQRKRRARVLVDVHGGLAPGAAAAAGSLPEPDSVENEYERQRLERIRRNEQMLQQLGVAEAAGGLAAAAAAEQQQQQRQQAAPRGPPRPRERRPSLPAVALPARKSKRQRGERPLAVEEAVAEAAAELIGGGATELAGASEKELENGALLDLESYFQLVGQDVSGAVHTDGRFRGWVNPTVCERYDIPPDPAAAWEAGGGGAFSFKIDKKAIPAAQRARGWSDARAFSHTQLVKNPNAYFYRHVAPHEQQAQGEWTEEEHRLFVETARAHGVGDKWGLFASYLPQRVGYQCSAYYRDVIIPAGLVIDRRFKMTRGGKAVYVG